MRVFVISHNVFSDTTSMGKTLSAYFNEWDATDIAQFYIHAEVPVIANPCRRYFRITDMDAVKSIITRKCGQSFDVSDIAQNRTSTRTDTGAVAKMYQAGRKRRPVTYIARNLIWRFSGWNNPTFQKWIDDFKPDVVFFASGDYAFLYRIALKIAKRRQIPLAISCMDDYYVNNKNQNSFLGRIAHKSFIAGVKKAMSYASVVFCICEKMSQDYSKLFKVKCCTLHTPSSFSQPLTSNKKNQISYIGNMGYGRHKQLAQIGRTLKELSFSDGPNHIDVYSAESREEVLQYLTEENGVIFHGQIPYEEVKKVMGESLAVIHTESFEKDIADVVRYSVSTKIADSLASGTCILAYGPEDVASIAYLKDNHAAVCISSPEELKDGLTTLFTREDVRKEIVANALKLASKNHRADKNSQMIYSVLNQNQ